MRIWLFVLSVLSVLSVLPQLCPGLSVVPDDWRPRERGVRGARGYGQARGINLYGSAKRHGAGRQECPRDQKILPCRCKAKTNGLDITCEKVSLSQIKHSSEALKKEFKNRSNSEMRIGYYKIRDSSLHRLPDYVFMGLTIVHLMIYNSNLQTLMPNSLPLSKLKHLVLSNNQLEDVPTVALRHLRELDHLNLGQNNITVLHDGAFTGLNRVSRLSLYDNKIHKIYPDAFDGLSKDLLRLSLVRNRLTEVPKESLIILKNLNQLDLSDNKISVLHQGTFEGMDKLDTLAMNHNLLTRLEAGEFEGLPRLTSLSLDYNKITFIDREAFRGLEGNLQFLSITHNKLNFIPSPALWPLHQIITLHLDDNNITRFEPDTFQGFGEHIKNLWLQNNHINKIPDETFEDLHSLEWLKLWNNELTSLSYSLMEPVLDTLKHLDIHSNPLVCDCEMRWYRKWYNDGWQDVDEDHIRDTECTDPTDGRAHFITQVDISHMFCAKPEQLSLGTSSILPSIFINLFSFLIFISLSS